MINPCAKYMSHLGLEVELLLCFFYFQIAFSASDRSSLFLDLNYLLYHIVNSTDTFWSLFLSLPLFMWLYKLSKFLQFYRTSIKFSFHFSSSPLPPPLSPFNKFLLQFFLDGFRIPMSGSKAVSLEFLLKMHLNPLMWEESTFLQYWVLQTETRSLSPLIHVYYSYIFKIFFQI